MKKQGRARKDPQVGTSAHNCTCPLQRETVGEDHTRTCLLYRQRGSGVPVFNGPRARVYSSWWSTGDHTSRSMKEDE